MTRTPPLLILLWMAISTCAVPAFLQLALADQARALPLQASDDDFDDVAVEKVENTDEEQLVARERLVRQRLTDFDPAYFEGIIFGTPDTQSIEGARKKLAGMAHVKVATIDLACGLNSSQRRKLRLAGEGDIKRLFDRIEELQGKWRLEKGPISQAITRQAIELRNTIAIGPFSSRSLFGKMLDRTLTAGQQSRCTEFGGIERLEETVRIRTWPDAPDKFKDIWLTATPIGDDGLERLQAMTSLQRLYIDSTQITDAGLAHLARLTNLEDLDLERTAINGSGLVHFRDMQRLKRLKLGYTQATDEGLAHLRELGSLKTLTLEKTRFTSRGMANLRLLTQLEALSLCETQVTDEGLAELAALKNLSELDLEATLVTDAGLSHLEGLTNLRVLDLRRTRVSDAGLARLARLTNLRKLWLGQTAVTEAGFARLEQSLPRTRVIR